jgi:hypothetical protein
VTDRWTDSISPCAPLTYESWDRGLRGDGGDTAIHHGPAVSHEHLKSQPDATICAPPPIPGSPDTKNSIDKCTFLVQRD